MPQLPTDHQNHQPQLKAPAPSSEALYRRLLNSYPYQVLAYYDDRGKLIAMQAGVGMADVIVVGAGLSGLMAARKILKLHETASVVILEARDRKHAIELLSKHPGLRNGPWEIRARDEAMTGEFEARNRGRKGA